MSHNGAHQSPLKPAQELVLAALMTGSTQTEAAIQAGVSRETVSRWMRTDRAFQEAYRERCAGLSLLLGSRLQEMTLRATGVLQEALDGPCDPELRVRAAVAVLQLTPNGNRQPPAAA